MLLRVLGLVVLIAGAASLITITLPAITSASFASSIGFGLQPTVSKDTLYLVEYGLCTSIPRSEAYNTYMSIELHPRGIPGQAWIRIRDLGRARLSVYIAPGCGYKVPVPYKVESFRELDNTIRSALSAQARSQLIAYRGLMVGSEIDVTRLGGKPVFIVVVFSLPADSFEVVAGGQVVPGRQAIAQMLSHSPPYNSLLWAASRSVEGEIRISSKPVVTPLSYARAASVIAAGLLVVVVDAGLHPEYYQGRWRVFARAASILGLQRRERG